jgi:hypothetical protein
MSDWLPQLILAIILTIGAFVWDHKRWGQK